MIHLTKSGAIILKIGFLLDLIWFFYYLYRLTFRDHHPRVHLRLNQHLRPSTACETLKPTALMTSQKLMEILNNIALMTSQNHKGFTKTTPLRCPASLMITRPLCQLAEEPHSQWPPMEVHPPPITGSSPSFRSINFRADLSSQIVSLKIILHH